MYPASRPLHKRPCPPSTDKKEKRRDDMKNHLLKRILSLMLVAALLGQYHVPGVQAASSGVTWKRTSQQVTPDLSDRKADIKVEETYAPTDVVRVSIVPEEKSTIQAGYSTTNIANNSEAMAYSRSLRAKQQVLANTISTQALGGQKLDVVWNLTLVGNIISANVPYGALEAIAEVEGVKDVFVENEYLPCVVEREEEVAQPQMFASLGMAGSSLVWADGYTGAGSRVAVIDTGTDTNHQSMDSGAFLYALEQNAKAKGVELDTYLAGLDLLDSQEIAAVLPDLNIYELDDSFTAADLYLNEKLPFAVNYIDGDLVVDHESDGQGEHGSHVAGIAVANRYIPADDGYVDALESVNMAGTAPDAQLITMKVFGTSGGPSDGDYLAAVEDAILLGCDAVNLSLGTSMAGDSFNTTYADLLDYLTRTDTVVVASAGNSYAWPTVTPFESLYSEDVNLDTVGAPGSYSSFFSVASVENDGAITPTIQVAGNTVAYLEGSNDGSRYSMDSLDVSDDLSGTDYDYVFIDGQGDLEDYDGIDLTGKIVFCSRGGSNFHVKGDNAASLGASATVVYNNQPGTFAMDLSYYNYTVPCVSITQADANTIRSASTAQTSSAGITYYTGTVTVQGKVTPILYHSDYYNMSSFSSWGVPGDLSIKPEITAPGGNIYSLYGETPYGGGADQYEVMSGTSMSAPAVTGMAALLAQYIQENGLAEQEGMKVRTLAQSLLMSTAVPMVEADSGSYYSIMKQGAGLARADLASSADSYILVDGQSDGKVKAELGDDPDRTGVYEFSFSINNLTDEDKDYTLSSDVFRQDVYDEGLASGDTAYGFTQLDYMTASLPATAVFTVNGTTVAAQADLSGYDMNGDGKTDGADADYLLEYVVGNETQLHGEGDVSGDGLVSSYDAHTLLTLLSSSSSFTVPAEGSVTVDVRLSLTEGGKELLEANYANGTYVQAYVYASSLADQEGVAGTVHSIPVLAFYGNWTDPRMFDHSDAVEMKYGYPERVPYMYSEIASGSANCVTINYGDGTEYYYGGNPMIPDDYYQPERNAFNSQDDSRLVGQYFTLIRGASDMQLKISNVDTDEVYVQRSLGSVTPAFYYVNGGSWYNVEQGVSLGWLGVDAQGDPLPEGTRVEVKLTAVPEYYRNEDGTHNYDALGDGASLTTQMVIDNTAPAASAMTQTDDTTLTVTAKDNQYVSAVVLMNAGGTNTVAYANPNQTKANTSVTVDLDLTGASGKNFLLAVYDYAMNVATYELTLDLPEVERPYFTMADPTTDTYYGMSGGGSRVELAVSGRGDLMAAEFVDGYVFEVSDARELYVSPDSDLYAFQYLGDLDPDNTYGIATFLDLAFNYADETLYGLFYCDYNNQQTPMLCSIDMYEGTMQVLYELPVDVNNMAIDGDGNFYSVGYNSTTLYTYTLDTLNSGTMTSVGDVGSYSTTVLNTMAWDHNTDTLYWGYPDTLLTVDPATATPTIVCYSNFQMVGLYIRPETWGDRFAPTTTVSGMSINYSQARALVGNTVKLTAQVSPWNVADDSVTWTSSNTAVATVDASGTVTGVSVGSATITATSVQDPTKTVSCAMSVVELDKQLQGIVWDADNNVWWSQFRSSTLPAYTKLTSEGAADCVASAALLNGTLYAATADTSSGSFRSKVYTVDPESFALTEVGSSTDGYTDLAPAPNIGGGDLAATYGGNVLFVDPSTGDYYEWFYIFEYNMTGIAYAGSTPYTEYGFDTVVDWYFLTDTQGNVFLLGFLEQDGTLYYLEHPDAPGGVFTTTDAVSDTPYFCSLHYDGQFLYYSCCNEALGISSLYAIDTIGSRAAYKLGTFGSGVYPVGGLMEPDASTTTSALLDVNVTAKPKAAENKAEVQALSVSQPAQSESAAVSGSLNAVSGDVILAPQSAGDFSPEAQQVTVTLTPVGDATNGMMTVSYDASELKLTGVTGSTEAFAWREENGVATVAFASKEAQSEDTAVALMTFDVVKAGQHSISVLHEEVDDGPCGKEEPLTVSTAATVVAEGWSGYVQWTLDSHGVLTVYGTGAMKNYAAKNGMPWYDYADQIRSVVIEEGVTSIGDYAFYGMDIQSIQIPDSVTTIGEYAFKNAAKLDNVVLPKNLTKLGQSAFYACTSLSSIEIPASLWTVQPYTFKNCTALTQVTFHEGNLMKISDGAFYGTGLTELVLPNCLDILDTYSFKGCKDLASITLGTGLTELREAVFYGTAISTITVPEGIAKIGPYVFKNCVNLTTIDLPQTLNRVGEAAFYACTNLEAVDLPDAVTTIGNYAFRKCTGLKELDLGSGMENIGESSFYGCTGLTTLNIPDSVTEIQPYAFKGCTGLTGVSLGSGVTTLGESAFHTCTGLESMDFPASLESIGAYCFSGSQNIQQMTFLGDAPSIGTSAFKGMTAKAYYPGSNATWTSAVMQNYGGSITWTAS